MTQLWVRDRVFYDATNQREYIEQERHAAVSDGVDTSFHIWALWGASPAVAYVLNVNSAICTRRPITTPFNPIGVPQQARFRSVQTIGTNGLDAAGVDVNIWRLVVNSTSNPLRPQLVYDIQTTSVGCVPVRETVFNFTGLLGDFQERNWFSTTPGIKDPKVFTPPAQCTSLMSAEGVAINFEQLNWAAALVADTVKPSVTFDNLDEEITRVQSRLAQLRKVAE